MSGVSEEAQDLLITLKRIQKIKTLGGEFIDKRRVLVEYGHDQNGKQLDELFTELKDAGYIKRNSGAYQLLAKASNWQPSTAFGQQVTIYSDVQHSNIAHLSPSTAQHLNVSELDNDTKEKLDVLIDAVERKDNSRVKAIVDGLIISSPALVLQILQLGLGVRQK
jgi:hypothetical protein